MCLWVPLSLTRCIKCTIHSKVLSSVRFKKNVLFPIVYQTRLLGSLHAHLLFQLGTRTLCIICKTKTNKNFADFIKKNRAFSKFSKIEFCAWQIFENSIIHKPSLGSPEVPHKVRPGSGQSFWRLLDTNKQTPKQSLQYLTYNVTLETLIYI